MKQHLKRIATPRTWIINRKLTAFITRPKPGAHSFEYGMPLGVILRDNLKLVSSMSEVKKVLNRKTVLVDGKRRKDHRHLVGLFDVIALPDLKKYFRLVLDKKARLVINEIDEKESTIKPCRVVGKTTIAKGKTQFNLHDGKNIVSEKTANVGDTLLLSLPKLEIKEVFSLKKGAQVFLIKGKHGGSSGVLKEIKGTEATFVSNNQDIETAKAYLFVLGDKKAEIKV